MPHISKTKLPETAVTSLQKELFALLTDGLSAQKRKAILRELLTDTEVIMLAKRLALIHHLVGKKSQYAISQQLGISCSTAARFDLRIEEGHYETLSTLFNTKKRSEAFWDRIEELLYIVPPVVKGRAFELKRKGQKRERSIN